MFIQFIFILFGLIQTEFIQQEFSPLLDSLVCAEYHSEDCGVFYVTTNIENVKVGDYVIAQDVETGEVSLKEVTDTFVRTSDHLRYLTTVDEEGDTQTIETTDSHPFWVVTDNPDLERAAGDFVVENGTILYHENLTVTEHGYYVEAKDLKIGDVFIGANGELTTLTGTERVEFPNGVTVYNFTVADNHNYYVIANLEAYENGASVVLVHNAGYHDHHIVMKSDHSKSWLPENSQYIKDTHKLLEDYKIDINDAANIVKHVPNKGHTIAYAKKVYEELSNVAENTIDLGKDVRQAIINKLKSIGREIIDQEYMK